MYTQCCDHDHIIKLENQVLKWCYLFLYGVIHTIFNRVKPGGEISLSSYTELSYIQRKITTPKIREYKNGPKSLNFLVVAAPRLFLFSCIPYKKIINKIRSGIFSIITSTRCHHYSFIYCMNCLKVKNPTRIISLSRVKLMRMDDEFV